ncbi:MAG TPA: pilus assembly protein N-terminal domain-containing protein, partial [Sphingomonas sp.]
MRLNTPSLAIPAAALLVAAGHAAPQQSRRPAPQRNATPASATVAPTVAGIVQVNTGRGRLVTLSRPMTDLFVADPGIADVQVRSPTQLYVFGKKTGETTVSATTKSGQVVFSATVRVGNNMDSVGQMLNLAMPEARIVSTPMNGLVLLTGTVATPADVAEAERLVQAFVGEDTKVISRLRTATPLQVKLHVRIAEVSRSFAKNIGANLRTFDGTGGFKFGVAQGRPEASTQFFPRGNGLVEGLFTGGTEASPGTSLVTKAPTSSTLGLAGRLLGLDLIGALDLGET